MTAIVAIAGYLFTIYKPYALLGVVLLLTFCVAYRIRNLFYYFITVFSPLILLLVLPFIIYRTPVSGQLEFKSEVVYRMVDLGFDDNPRYYIENWSGNRRIYLKDEKIKWIYIDSNDYRKLWPESPFELRKKSYTIVGTFRIRKILAGGYGVAEVVDTVHMVGDPDIWK